MAKQTINVGTLANDGTGDPARTAFGKCNSNFDELYAGAGSQATTLTGDVTGTGTGSFVATIANNAVSNAKAAQMAAGTIKGNNTGATANQLDLTAAQVQAMVGLPTSTTAGRLARYTDATGAQGQTTGLHEDVNGNVGIGTTAPNNKLDVNGTLGVVNGAGRYVTLSQSGTEARFVTNDKYWFDTDGAVRASINDGGLSVGSTYYSTDAPSNGAIIQGNVGIGTTSPATTLDVNGPIKAKSYTVATLPAAATVGAGTHAYVTDAASTFALGLGGTVSGGGGNFSRVTSDGSNWKQM